MGERVKLGIMGGTFDPIHYGHLVTAEVARAAFNLDKVIFIPAGKPPHKTERQVSDAQHRLTMTLLATVTNRAFTVSDMELKRCELSYTYETVMEVHKIYGEDTDIYFITGADAIKEIFTWYRYEELLAQCNFIAATRPGYSLKEFSRSINEREIFADNVSFMEVPALAISSTDIRRRVRVGEPIKYLVPETVETYIDKCNLYKTKG